MNELLSNLLRGSVSTVMYVILLFTLTKSKYGKKTTIIVASFVFVLNIASDVWFYLHGDLTGLSRYSIVLFIIIGLLLKPLTRLSFMQWCFTFLTTTNIAMMIIILSFHLGRLFYDPYTANTIFRFILYLIVIRIFQRYLAPSYRSVIENWPAFSTLMIAIFLNLSYYFFVTDDIKGTLAEFKWPLILLVLLSISSYGTVFYSLKKFSMMRVLESENVRIHEEAGKLQETAITLEQYANYDMLTNLPNRRFFFAHLEKLISTSREGTGNFALFYIDLDGFKGINDTYGHEIGDEVLIAVGKRLMQCTRGTDFLARLGGDEFAMIIQGVHDANSAVLLGRRFLQRLLEPITIESVTCSVDASIGIALFPQCGDTGEVLLRHADAAMYEAKRGKQGGVMVYKQLMT